jgi:hypothetical protein
VFANRFRRLFQAVSLKWVEPYFAQNPPGEFGRAVIRILGPMVRRLQPNDQWNLDIFISQWAKLLNTLPIEPLPKTKRIFIFSCYRGQLTQDVIIAFLMAWRGHSITLGYLPKLQSPIKEPLEDNPRAAEYLDAVLGRIEMISGGRVVCVNLSNYRCAETMDDAYFFGQMRADVIMKIRRESFSEDDPEVRLARAYYSDLGRNARGIAMAYLIDYRDKIDLCLIANGASFENGYFCNAAKKLGIPVNTHEKFAFSKARVVTHGDAFFQFSDLDRIWARRKQLGFLDDPLRGSIIKKGWELLNQRRDSTGNMWGLQYQKSSRGRTEEELRVELGIRDNKFALVCPNVPFDAGYDGWLEIFPSMRDWLVQTLEVLLKQESLFVIVRAHPAETRPGYGREKISEIIREAGLVSARLILLPGDSKINTYDLMPMCQFAAVFASTTGVEVAMHGKPVIAGASVYYARCGITLPVADRSDYLIKLIAVANNTADFISCSPDDAAMLYFIFHYLLQWPFPYDKPSQISAKPLHELSTCSAVSTYIDTLDILSMNYAEFDQILPSLFTKEKIERRWGWEF